MRQLKGLRVGLKGRSSKESKGLTIDKYSYQVMHDPFVLANGVQLHWTQECITFFCFLFSFNFDEIKTDAKERFSNDLWKWFRQVFVICFISQWMKRSKHGLFVFPPKKTLIWRRHCSIGQSCCSMTSKRSIDWFLESSRAWNFFTRAFA